MAARRWVKHLCISMDDKMRYKEHTRRAVSTANKSTTALLRLLPNLRASSYENHRILTQSTLLYGAPVWHYALTMRLEKYQKIVENSQRGLLFWVGYAYKTVSSTAIQIATGISLIGTRTWQEMWLIPNLTDAMGHYAHTGLLTTFSSSKGDNEKEKNRRKAVAKSTKNNRYQ